MNSPTLSTGADMIRRIQATPVRPTPQPRPWKHVPMFVSDCCNAVADDWYQEIKRCPACKESCELEDVG